MSLQFKMIRRLKYYWFSRIVLRVTVHWYNELCYSTEYLFSVVRSIVYFTYDVGSLEYILSVVRSSV